MAEEPAEAVAAVEAPAAKGRGAAAAAKPESSEAAEAEEAATAPAAKGRAKRGAAAVGQAAEPAPAAKRTRR